MSTVCVESSPQGETLKGRTAAHSPSHSPSSSVMRGSPWPLTGDAGAAAQARSFSAYSANIRGAPAEYWL